MNKKNIAACTVCLLIGVIVGRLPLSEAEQENLSGEFTHQQERREKASIHDLKEERGLSHSKVSKQLQSESDASGTAAGADLVSVPASLIGELSLAAGVRASDEDLFSRDARIQEILNITDYEKARVKTAWQDSRQKIRNLETASMELETIDEWTVLVIVPDLSQKLAPIGDNFRSELHKALGENRAESFIAVKQLDHTFSPPAGERAYRITTEQIGDGGWRYRFELEGPSGRRVWVGENIPDELKHLSDAAKIEPLKQ